MALSDYMTENIMRLARGGYGGGVYAPGAIKDILQTRGQYALGLRRQKAQEAEQIRQFDVTSAQREKELQARLKQIEANIETEAARLGLSKEQLAEQIRQFNESMGLRREQFGFQRETTPTFKESAALGLVQSGYGTRGERENILKRYGITLSPEKTETTMPAAAALEGTAQPTGHREWLRARTNGFRPNLLPSRFPVYSGGYMIKGWGY